MTIESDGQQAARVWKVARRVAWTDLSDRAIVLATEQEEAQPFALEGSAYVIWAILARHSPMGETELVDRVADEFGLDSAPIGPDVVSLLAELHRAQVVIIV